MKHQTPIFIAVAVLTIFLLGGCSNLLSFGKGNQKELAVTQESLRTGTDALVFSFNENSPPKQAYEGQNVPVAFTLSNKGASNIQNGKLILSYDDAFLQNLNEPWKEYDESVSSSGNLVSFTMAGKSIDNPEGEIQVYSKNFMAAKSIGANRQSVDASIIATACYDYQTQKSIPICIDTIPYQNINKPCKTSAVTLDSEGAPLAITKVTPTLVPKINGYELTVDIDLANKGKGQLYQKGQTESACGGNSVPQNIITEEEIELRLGSDEQNNFKCSPLPLKITGTDSSLRCTYNQIIPISQPYSTALFISIGYGYSSSISTQTKILKGISVIS